MFSLCLLLQDGNSLVIACSVVEDSSWVVWRPPGRAEVPSLLGQGASPCWSLHSPSPGHWRLCLPAQVVAVIPGLGRGSAVLCLPGPWGPGAGCPKAVCDQVVSPAPGLACPCRPAPGLPGPHPWGACCVHAAVQVDWAWEVTGTGQRWTWRPQSCTCPGLPGFAHWRGKTNVPRPPQGAGSILWGPRQAAASQSKWMVLPASNPRRSAFVSEQTGSLEHSVLCELRRKLWGPWGQSLTIAARGDSSSRALGGSSLGRGCHVCKCQALWRAGGLGGAVMPLCQAWSAGLPEPSGAPRRSSRTVGELWSWRRPAWFLRLCMRALPSSMPRPVASEASGYH